jgi:hypothetical protein
MKNYYYEFVGALVVAIILLVLFIRELIRNKRIEEEKEIKSRLADDLNEQVNLQLMFLNDDTFFLENVAKFKTGLLGSYPEEFQNFFDRALLSCNKCAASGIVTIIVNCVNGAMAANDVDIRSDLLSFITRAFKKLTPDDLSLMLIKIILYQICLRDKEEEGKKNRSRNMVRERILKAARQNYSFNIDSYKNFLKIFDEKIMETISKEKDENTIILIKAEAIKIRESFKR